MLSSEIVHVFFFPSVIVIMSSSLIFTYYDHYPTIERKDITKFLQRLTDKNVNEIKGNETQF